MRKKIWGVLNGKGKLGSVYDIGMLVVIVTSLVPLVFKTTNNILDDIENVCVAIFIVDYAARWLTAGFKLEKGKASYILYPVTPLAILDLLCILPSFTVIANGFRILKVVRLFRSLRVFRSFKLLRYSKSIDLVVNAIKKEANALITVFGIATGYVLIAALVMFNLEPDIFGNFFDAVYWSVISLVAIGYGDIVPVTIVGKLVTIISAMVGVAIIALPSGIITAGLMSEINKEK